MLLSGSFSQQKGVSSPGQQNYEENTRKILIHAVFPYVEHFMATHPFEMKGIPFWHLLSGITAQLLSPHHLPNSSLRAFQFCLIQRE